MPSLALEVAISGCSVGTATLLTNPFDVLKTRLQLQTLRVDPTLLLQGANVRPPGLVGTAVKLIQEEGILALWKGLPPALARGFIYGGLRLGMYTPIKTSLLASLSTMTPLSQSRPLKKITYNSELSPHSATSDLPDPPQPPAVPQGSGGASAGVKELTHTVPPPPPEDLSFLGKLAAGSLSGGGAAAISNPTELIKTRLQSKDSSHGGSLGVIRHIVASEGLGGLWRGAGPAMSRAALVTACQCATYDEIKRAVVRYSGWGESLVTHLTSSTLAGLIATTITNPIDVVKTVVFVSGSKYRSSLEAAADIWRSDGLPGFFKGWVANFARLGPQTVITFIVFERLRDFAGLDHF